MTIDDLWLADWRRRTWALSAEVRALAAADPAAAWERWRTVRESLYREHPQSPVPAAERAGFRARHWAYDARYRSEVVLELDAAPTNEPGPLRLPMSVGPELAFERLGRVEVGLPGGVRALAVYRLLGYAGGLFLPFRDATNGSATYGAGRYLLDTAKGADLGGDPAQGRLVLDFNFAYHPSCAFDARWSCPLAPPENRLDLPIEAGERLR